MIVSGAPRARAADLEKGRQQSAVDVHLDALRGADEPSGGSHQQRATNWETEVSRSVVIDPFAQLGIVLLAPVGAGTFK
jgi:hypothetical protein